MNTRRLPSDIRRALVLHRAWLRGKSWGASADLSDADIQDSDLSYANLRGANLRGADLRGADLYKADLCGAILCGADLCGADLNFAILRGADLRGADLRGAILVDAILCDAILCDAILCGADLFGADLRSVDLRHILRPEGDLMGISGGSVGDYPYTIGPGWIRIGFRCGTHAQALAMRPETAPSGYGEWWHEYGDEVKERIRKYQEAHA